MCLIIHKPAGVTVPRPLLQSAADHNGDGFGFMAFGGGRRLKISRRPVTHPWELLSIYEDYAAEECVIHLRRTTRGLSDADNTHPFLVTDRIGLVHNGTLDVHCHSPGRSDTWHLVEDVLRPILVSDPQVLYGRTFQSLLAGIAGPANKFVFMDAGQQRTVIVNRDHGVELDGLWLSNGRWFDAPRFGVSLQGTRGPWPTLSRLSFLN
jgi:hypothetical protein